MGNEGFAVNGEMVSDLIREKFMTISGVAKVAGLSRMTVHSAVHGGRLKVWSVQKLAAALGVEPKSIIKK